MSVAVKSLRLHSTLSLVDCGAAVALPHGQTGAYAEHLVPLEESAAASQLWAAQSAATGCTSRSNAILWLRRAKPLQCFAAVVAALCVQATLAAAV